MDRDRPVEPDAWHSDKPRILREISFGARVAEEEAAELKTYFVETDQWLRLYRGDIDVVYGAKGSGKSAMFALLLSREDALFDRHILMAAVEDPRGAPVFGQLVVDEPPTEFELRALWKLYFLSIIGQVFREYRLTAPSASRVLTELERAGLIERTANLRRLLHATLEYVRSVTRATGFEATLAMNPGTGMPIGITGRITFREPTSFERAQFGLVSVDEVIDIADQTLAEADFSVWLVLDRLDVAFAESERLESNALRALFRVYMGFRRLERISLKIFLRSDIWERITKGGFREASHVTRGLTITWNDDSLLHLIVRRLLRNDVVRFRFGVDDRKASTDRYQRHLFYTIFPRRRYRLTVADTFEWVISLVTDGSGVAAPRELIHLFNAARDAQIRRLEMGQPPPIGDLLFDLVAFGDALEEVSQARLRQTIFAEYPQYRPWIEGLSGERVEHTTRTLATTWSVNDVEATRRAERLAGIGVLRPSGSRATIAYQVPLLYRPALGLLSGSNWVYTDR